MKSTYETLNAQTTDTSVPHYSNDNVEHNLPAGMFPDGETYVDASRLEQWARETGNMHSLLQLGVQQGLIKVRATFKSVKKDDVWTPDYGQANVDAWNWPVQDKPKSKKTQEQIAKEYLAALSPEQLKALLNS
jgi:hypothetical protein